MKASCAALLIATGAGAQEGLASLRIFPTARENALAGGVAGALGPAAAWYNPALLPAPSAVAGMASHGRWLLGSYETGLFVRRALPWFTLGVTVTDFTAGPVEVRPDHPTDRPVGYFQPHDVVCAVTAARRLDARTAVGLTAKAYFARIYAASATGLGLDLGIASEPAPWLRLGLVVTNYGRNLVLGDEEVALPTAGRVGARVQLPASFTASAEAGYYFFSRRPETGVGLEWQYRRLALRAGYRPISATPGPSFGIGLGGRGLSLDYSLECFRTGFAPTHLLSVRLEG